MKLFRILLFSTIFLGLESKAQWVQLSSINTSNAIHFTSVDTGFVVCTGGKIYKTSDGGYTWDTTNTIFTMELLNDIYFPSKKTGYSCGGSSFGNYSNILLKTTNGGETWNTITSKLSAGGNYNSLHFINDSIGLILGSGFISLLTRNGGNTFDTIDFVNSYGLISLSSVYFTDHNIIYVSGYKNLSNKTIPQILKTIDQGLTWNIIYSDTTQSSSFNDSKKINSIQFLNKNIGYAVCDNGWFLKTTDAGNNWSKTQIVADSSILGKVEFVNTTTGYVTLIETNTDNSFILKTTDGGVSWIKIAIEEQGWLKDLYMLSEDVGYTLGGKMYKINNGVNSIFSIKTSKEISLYPNPANNAITVEVKNLSFNKLEVFDLQGQLIKNIDCPNTKFQFIETSILKSGMYILKITTLNNEIITQKFSVVNY